MVCSLAGAVAEHNISVRETVIDSAVQDIQWVGEALKYQRGLAQQIPVNITIKYKQYKI